MDILQEVKIRIKKLNPSFKSLNDIEKLIKKKHHFFKKKVISKIYVTPGGKLKYKGNQNSKSIYLEKYQAEYTRYEKLDILIQNGHLDEFINDRTERLKNRNIEKLFTLLDEDSDPKRNVTNNRLDYNLTNFPNDFISELMFDGETIVELDLVNSQLCILFNFLEQVKGNHGNILKLPSAETIYRLIGDGNSNTYLCSDFWSTYSENDVKLFKDYVFNGIIYDQLGKLAITKGDSIGKDKIKELAFSLIFGKYNSFRLNQKNLLSLHFPNVLKLIKCLKEAFEVCISEGVLLPIKSANAIQNEAKYDLNYLYGNNYLPIFLQRLEAEIFIDQILPALYEHSICALPKHDSIMLKMSELEKALEIVNLKLHCYFGNNYRIKTKWLEL